MMAVGRGSAARMVQNSEELRSQFRARLARSPTFRRSKIRNLRAAKHRFESLQRPLGRACKLLRPLVALMAQVANERRDDAAKKAKEWLAFLAESPQHALQCGMLADAADEGMLLTRPCDAEAMDVASLAARISTFLDRVTNLFGPNSRCLTVPGYIGIILEQLRQPTVWFVGERGYTPTPPSQGDINTCLGRMRAWLRLAAAEISAEFPSWEVAQSFRIFDLVAGTPQTQSPDFHRHVSRLARACGVNSDMLQAELDDHEHHALQPRHQLR